MLKRVWVGALGAAMVALAGCGDNDNDVECRSASECTGTPATGNEFACVDNRCVERPVGTSPAPGGDGGTPDAGPPVGDGGTNLTEGQPCAASSQCGPGLRCEGTCQPLHLAFTLRLGDGQRAAAVRFNKNVSPTLFPQPDGGSFWPRWSPAGDRAAVVEGRGASDAGPGFFELVTYPLPPTTEGRTKLAEAGDPNVKGPVYSDNFFNLEWAPGKQLAFVRGGNTNGIGGIVLVPPEGGTPLDATPGGSFPSFNGDGSRIAFSAAGQGLITIPAVQPFQPAASVGGANTGIEHEPFYDAAGSQLLYLKQTGTAVFNGDGDTFPTELSSLFVVPAAGGTPQPVAEVVQGTPDAEGRTVNSYVSMHNFSADGRLAAYVRVNYSTYTTSAPPPPPPTDGGTPDGDAGTPDAGPGTPVVTHKLCGSSNPVCPNTAANDVFVRRLDAQGAPTGPEMLLARGATLPSISPDSRFVAYVAGGVLFVQPINPDAASEDALRTSTPIQHSATSAQGRVVTNGADDVRPRWQPR